MRKVFAVVLAAVTLALVVVIGLAQCDQPPTGFDPPHTLCAPTPFPAADGEWLACCAAWCVPRERFGTPLPESTIETTGSLGVSILPMPPIATVQLLDPTPTPTGMVSAEWYLSEHLHTGGMPFCSGDFYSSTWSATVENGYCSCNYGQIDPALTFVFTATEPTQADWIQITGRWQRTGYWCATTEQHSACRARADVDEWDEVYFSFSGTGPPRCEEIDETDIIVVWNPNNNPIDQIDISIHPYLRRPHMSGPVDATFTVLDVQIGTGFPPSVPTPTPGPETPTPTPIPPWPTPQFPEICATIPPSVPLLANTEMTGGLTIIPGECRTIIPGVDAELPGDLDNLVIPGFELCYDWLVLPQTEILGWTIPIGTLISLIAAAFLWRLVNQAFGG